MRRSQANRVVRRSRQSQRFLPTSQRFLPTRSRALSSRGTTPPIACWARILRQGAQTGAWPERLDKLNNVALKAA